MIYWQQGVVPNDRQKQMMLEKIQTEVDSMSRLINDILMLSRLESMDIEAEIMPLKNERNCR